MALWEEYEAGESAEARLVKDMDKLEMIAQAMEYETEENTGRGGGFGRVFREHARTVSNGDGRGVERGNRATSTAGGGKSTRRM